MWYVYRSLEESKNIEEDLVNLFDDTNEFIEHLERIHELEMFYGDENLQSLIDHSKSLINGYIDLQEQYYNVEVELEKDEEYDDKEKYDDKEEESTEEKE